jgi:hypothetical protein
MAKHKEKSSEEKSKTCGIVMPIAPHPDYPNDHWKDVLGILVEAIQETEFEPKLVSDDVAIGLIHERIVTNLYHNEIVVCDVSSKNPNVMFELGLRLAFDKPTIIIKDERTGYSFDTGVIEHLNYPSSLRFSQIVDFKAELVKRLNATYQKSISETDYSPFLRSFGKTIVPSSIQQTEIPEGKYILEQLDKLRHEIRAIRFPSNKLNKNEFVSGSVTPNVNLKELAGILDDDNINYFNLDNDDDLYNLIGRINDSDKFSDEEKWNLRRHITKPYSFMPINLRSK